MEKILNIKSNKKIEKLASNSLIYINKQRMRRYPIKTTTLWENNQPNFSSKKNSTNVEQHTFLIRQAKYHFSPFGPVDSLLRFRLQIPTPQGHIGALILNSSHHWKKLQLAWKKYSKIKQDMTIAIDIPFRS